MLFLNCRYWVWHKLQQSTAWPRESWGTSALHRWSCFGETLLLFCYIYAISWMGAQAPTCQRHQGEPEGEGHGGWSSWLHQVPPPPPWCPGPSCARQIHRGAANPLQSWDCTPKMIPVQLDSPTHSTPWKVSMGSASSGEGRWASRVSLSWTWAASSAPLPS